VPGGTTASTIQTALYNLPNVNNGAGISNVQATSGIFPHDWGCTVTFVNALGGSVQPLITVVNDTTPGVTATYQSVLSATIDDAFSSGVPLAFTGTAII
jgi:hypothetical protein